MNSDDAEETRRLLTSIAIENGLEWVTIEAARRIDEGFLEERRLQRSTKDGYETYSELNPKTVKPRGPRREQEFTSVRQMTATEALEVLIEALKRVLVDLPAISRFALEQLQEDTVSTEDKPDSSYSMLPAVASIVFAPESSEAGDRRIDLAEAAYSDERVTAAIHELSELTNS